MAWWSTGRTGSNAWRLTTSGHRGEEEEEGWRGPVVVWREGRNDGHEPSCSSLSPGASETWRARWRGQRDGWKERPMKRQNTRRADKRGKDNGKHTEGEGKGERIRLEKGEKNKAYEETGKQRKGKEKKQVEWSICCSTHRVKAGYTPWVFNGPKHTFVDDVSRLWKERKPTHTQGKSANYTQNGPRSQSFPWTRSLPPVRWTTQSLCNSRGIMQIWN